MMDVVLGKLGDANASIASLTARRFRYIVSRTNHSSVRPTCTSLPLLRMADTSSNVGPRT